MDEIFDMKNIEKFKDTIQETGSKFDIINNIGLIITVIVFILLIYYLYIKINLNDTNCKYMNTEYPKMAPLKSINEKEEMFSHNLRDYYIKTAYNACCAGDFKNDYVNICALKNCIKQGARCLDFEIYSIDNKPVVAASSVTNFTIKETYNSVPFTEVIRVISDYAFSGATSPCFNDPLLLHFRIMSNNVKMHDEMAEILNKQLERRLLGPIYSVENNIKNIVSEPLGNFKGKVIIMIDKSNPFFENTKLKEYVNITTNSEIVRKLRFSDGIRLAQDTNELINFNKKNMTICLPDIGAMPTNYSISIPIKYGCQMIAVCYQNYDTNMQYYEKYFNDNHHAFVLKAETLRYIPIKVIIPPAASPEIGLNTRNASIANPFTRK